MVKENEDSPVFGRFGLSLIAAAGGIFLTAALSNLVSGPIEKAENALRQAETAISVAAQHGEEFITIRQDISNTRSDVDVLRAELKELRALTNRFREQLSRGGRWTYEQQVEYQKRVDGDIRALEKLLDSSIRNTHEQD